MTVIVKKECKFSPQGNSFVALSQQGSAEMVIRSLYLWHGAFPRRPLLGISDKKAHSPPTQAPGGFHQEAEASDTTGKQSLDCGSYKWKSHLVLQMLARAGWPSALRSAP